MSQRRDQLAERLSFLGPVLDYVESWYHVPLLVVFVAFMLWIRVRDWTNFIVNGRVFYSGNDAWYHYREVMYTVRHWPNTMPFDPWTGFPLGKSVGQFGTLYDQLVATTGLLFAGGANANHEAALALLFAPAVLGTLTAIPAYFLARRFGGRAGGVVGIALLALAPGTFLSRSIAGFSDHQAAEAFFQVLAAAAVVTALAVAEREKPVYEQFTDRDLSTLRRPVGWAAVAGLCFTLYVWVWPPGILLVGVFGVFLLLWLPITYLRGESPEHVAITGAVALGVAGILMLLTFKTTEVSASTFSLLQPGLALVGAVGCAFLAWLARTVESRDLSPAYYPGTILGLFVVAVVVMAVALPDLFDFFVEQLTRVVGFGSSATSLTVAEAQPPYTSGASLGTAAGQAVQFFVSSYGIAALTAVVGAGVLGYRLARQRTRHAAAAAFVLVWTVFMVAATLTQRRFDYYVVVPMAVLNAVFIRALLGYLAGTGVPTSLRKLRYHQVLAVVFVVLVLVVPLFAFSSSALTAAGASAEQGSHPGSSIRGWDESLYWLQNNTPAEGTYGGADNPMAYYGTYQRTDNYDYPNGAYGIMSWWDYGHWITTLGHRIPVANPFQQNAHDAANFLLAPNASRANQIATTPDGSGVRYVMIDWKMADIAGGGLFTAPFSWYTDGPISLYDDVTAVGQVSGGSFSTQFFAYEQRHYRTMRTRLYTYHGSEIERKPVVLDYDQAQRLPDGSLEYATAPSGNDSAVKRFDSMAAARRYVQQDGSAQIGGVGKYPEHRVPALQHYRLVDASQKNALSGSYSLYQSAITQLQTTGLNASALYPTTMNWVKTFERVPGANVTGTGPANATVEATVEMNMPGNATFNYTQQATTDAQGRFNMTLPYSTTGYDTWGTSRGATNVSVRSNGPYTFNTTNGSQWRTTAQVPEGAVIGRTNGPIDVTLQRGSGGGASTSANATNASAGANETGVSVTNASPDSGTSNQSATNTSSGGNSSALGAPTGAMARVHG